jgi:hypothetical protein
MGRRAVGILALMLAALSVERCLPFAFETDDLVDTKRPQLTVLDRFVVFDQGHSAFPSVVRVPGGRVLVVFRNGIQHADPSGKIMMVSYAYDSVAKRFAPTDTNTIIDTPADDRDPHITALSNGTLLVNFFTRVELSPTSEDVEVHVSQSEDSGRSWHAWASFPNPWPARWLATSDAIHESPGGRLLMATYGVVAADGTSSGLLYQSRDAGRSWEYSGVIGRDPSQRLEFYEPAVALHLLDEFRGWWTRLVNAGAVAVVGLPESPVGAIKRRAAAGVRVPAVSVRGAIQHQHR